MRTVNRWLVYIALTCSTYLITTSCVYKTADKDEKYVSSYYNHRVVSCSEPTLKGASGLAGVAVSGFVFAGCVIREAIKSLEDEVNRR